MLPCIHASLLQNDENEFDSLSVLFGTKLENESRNERKKSILGDSHSPKCDIDEPVIYFFALDKCDSFNNPCFHISFQMRECAENFIKPNCIFIENEITPEFVHTLFRKMLADHMRRFREKSAISSIRTYDIQVSQFVTKVEEVEKNPSRETPPSPKQQTNKGTHEENFSKDVSENNVEDVSMELDSMITKFGKLEVGKVTWLDFFFASSRKIN